MAGVEVVLQDSAARRLVKSFSILFKPFPIYVGMKERIYKDPKAQFNVWAPPAFVYRVRTFCGARNLIIGDFVQATLTKAMDTAEAKVSKARKPILDGMGNPTDKFILRTKAQKKEGKL